MPAPKKRKTQWVYAPDKRQKPKVPDDAKQTITQQLQTLIETHLAPRYLHQSQHRLLVIETLTTQWHRNFIYLSYTYTCHHPDLPLHDHEPTKAHSARIEYIAPDQFNLAYFRHTGKWWTTRQNITLETALNEIRRNEIYHP